MPLSLSSSEYFWIILRSLFSTSALASLSSLGPVPLVYCTKSGSGAAIWINQIFEWNFSAKEAPMSINCCAMLSNSIGISIFFITIGVTISFNLRNFN
ncbi:hypothetical protein JCM19301_2127 [Jejuia pallidilutea]|nr:hypothetical protein JCM19301_2127 [Jejuia pallidilutea]GAL70666.1 hypothetical protein JCM19302_2388 [Jejuia pallidilutea]